MVEIISLLLGLVVGSQRVELSVTGAVAHVELLIDGETAVILDEAPWIASVDFGPLAPHELVVIARSASGRELDRARRWINVRQDSAGASMEVLTDRSGKPAALSLAWEIVGQRWPEKIEVSFDGQKLEVVDPKHVPLPAYDLEDFHFLNVSVHFGGGEVSRLQAAFGGRLGQEISTDLTAVAVALDGSGGLPAPHRMQSWFLGRGEPLSVHGVETPPKDIYVVRDPAVQPELDELARRIFDDGYDGNMGPRGQWGEWSPARFFARDSKAQQRELRDRADQFEALTSTGTIGGNSTLYIVTSEARPIFPAGVVSEMFRASGPHSGAEGGFSWLSQNVRPMRFPSHVAAAVALAGRAAHASGRRRVVLLIAGPRSADSSQVTPTEVRRYLRQLQVPLVVWSFAPEFVEAEWGEIPLVCQQEGRSRRGKECIEQVARRLERELKSQRIVWLEGRHLPQTIALGTDAAGTRLAGR